MPPRAVATAEPLRCKICGENADGQHFGADACRACAAFYRRTVARNLKYVCRFNNQCEISQSYRCMCRSCRLTKCEAVGMKKEAVQQSRVPAGPILNGKSTRSKHRHSEQGNNNFNKLASPQSSASSNYDVNASTSGELPQWNSYTPQESPTTASISQKLKSLQAIIEKSKKTIIIDPSTLPINYPNLTKMLYGYEELQRLRDVQFCRATDLGGVSTRTFVEKEFLDMANYVNMMYAEVANVAEMLNLFHGFNDLSNSDKLVLFKNFWIHFTILERCFDTYRVLGPNQEDNRMVFSDGSIVNVMIEERVKADHVTDANMIKTRQLYSLLRPWFRLAAELLCPIVKQLQPSPLEMAFCYGIMFYGCEDQLSPLYSDTRTSEVSTQTLDFMRQMTKTLYDELNAHYQTENMPNNIVERVGELMRFISKAERMVWHRKEDILMTKTFNVFKIDVYLENLFNES
ncbi:hypothetical protein M3Y97_00970600 [Aphelenchoides bicaudatus]|nr:hypothetical protein M3Y97_00970600 [Aphelenchoides bicaudatus]